MSATLQPFDTLKEVLQIKRETMEIAFGSPFPREDCPIILRREEACALSLQRKSREVRRREAATC